MKFWLEIFFSAEPSRLCHQHSHKTVESLVLVTRTPAGNLRTQVGATRVLYLRSRVVQVEKLQYYTVLLPTRLPTLELELATS